MFEFVTIFFPSILSTSVVLSAFLHHRDFQKGITCRGWLLSVKLFTFYVLFNNITSLLIFSTLVKVDATVVDGHLNPAFLSLKYIILASITALFWGHMGKALMFNVKLSLSRELIVGKSFKYDRAEKEDKIVE